MQTYIEANFTICKIIEVRGIPQLYKSCTFYYPYTRNLPIQRGRICVFYMLVSILLSQNKSFQTWECLLSLQSSGQTRCSAVFQCSGGCVMHKALKFLFILSGHLRSWDTDHKTRPFFFYTLPAADCSLFCGSIHTYITTFASTERPHKCKL